MVLGTECLRSSKSNYHMITTTAIPFKERSLAAIPFTYLRGTYLLKATNLEVEEGSVVVVAVAVVAAAIILAIKILYKT